MKNCRDMPNAPPSNFLAPKSIPCFAAGYVIGTCPRRWAFRPYALQRVGP